MRILQDATKEKKDSSSAHDETPFEIRPVDSIGPETYTPLKKSVGYPSRGRKWELARYAFVPLWHRVIRGKRCRMSQEYKGAYDIVHLGSSTRR